MTKSTSGGCDQFETSPEAIEPELLTAFCERRQTDRLKTNYRIDDIELVTQAKVLRGTLSADLSGNAHVDTIESDAKRHVLLFGQRSN